jgi:hypothetical protein
MVAIQNRSIRSSLEGALLTRTKGGFQLTCRTTPKLVELYLVQYDAGMQKLELR